MKPALVTVCLPVYNAAPYLDEAIQSVLDQDISNWVLLVSDNCSTDNSLEVIRKYQDLRIQVFQQKTNLGVSGNWHYLAAKVETPYFCILGADDIFCADHLRRKVEILENVSEAPFVHGRVQFIDETGKSLEPDHFECNLVEKRKLIIAQLLRVNVINITSAMFRTASLRENNSVFEARYPIMMDWALFLRLSLLHLCVAYDDQITAFYRIHSQSVARLKIKTFQWTHETASVLLDSLVEHREIWKLEGIDPDEESARITLPFWPLAIQQLRKGNLENARKIWKMFRQFHAAWTPLFQVPGYLINVIKRRFLGR